MSHENFLASHEEAVAEAAESLAERYRAGEHALGGACPMGLLSDGGYCSPLNDTTNLFALLADNELPCGCLPGFPHGSMCQAAPPEPVSEPAAA